MNDKTLRLIGRKHTVSQIKETFFLARERGFDNINMDLILGLPGEDLEDVRYTFSEIENLSPDSLTVHTLAVKRASDLRGTLERFPLAASEEIEKMLDISADFAKREKKPRESHEKIAKFCPHTTKLRGFLSNFDIYAYQKG